METEINKWYKTRKFIEDKVNKWNTETLPEGIESFKPFVKDIVNNSFLSDENKFKLLKDTIKYFEIYNLKERYHESYLDAKYNLNQISLKPNKIPPNDKEDAFYEWLKVCINSQNDPNIDFYFEKEQETSLSKENEIRKILFLDYKEDISLYRIIRFEKGKLREMFKKNEWQIRLRKIRTWFLKRYDWGTAIKLHRDLKDNSIFESLDLFFPRLLCATLVGFTPLLFDSETWKLPPELSVIDIIFTLLFSFISVYIYLSYEYSKVTGNEKNISIFRRVLPILLLGTIASFIFSFIFYGIYFFYVNSYFQWYSSLSIITFFASVALFIGVLIQTIWEEKTVTEPL